MEKEFLPYELAVKLKALGYDEEGLGTYSVSGQVLPLKPYTTESKAILFSQAFRWFREKCEIPFAIHCDNDLGLGYIRGYYPVIAISNKHRTEPIYQDGDCFTTYEEAELACLDKLLEIVEFKSE